MATSGKGVQVSAGYERGLAKQSYEPFTSKNRNTLMVVSSSESESRSPRNTFAHDFRRTEGGSATLHDGDAKQIHVS